MGVWFSTVTRSRLSSRQNSSGDRLVAYGTTTRRPPNSSAPQISHTEKSNAKEWNSVHTSRGPRPKSSPVDSKSRRTLWWETTTPFGVPVEPEVWMTYAGASPSTGTGGAGEVAGAETKVTPVPVNSPANRSCPATTRQPVSDTTNPRRAGG